MQPDRLLPEGFSSVIEGPRRTAGALEGDPLLRGDLAHERGGALLFGGDRGSVQALAEQGNDSGPAIGIGSGHGVRVHLG